MSFSQDPDVPGSSSGQPARRSTLVLPSHISLTQNGPPEVTYSAFIIQQVTPTATNVLVSIQE